LSIFEIPISQCVTFGGFRYGPCGYHPIQSYQVDLVNGVPLAAARQRSIEFYRYYRPRHMGEALGMIPLSQEYPLWLFPWQRVDPDSFAYEQGWCATHLECRDILTHFCGSVIPSFLLDREFFWSERALYSIAENDYLAERYESYVQTMEFRRSDGSRVYLLKDGNHRAGAMFALGYETVTVQQALTDVVLESDLDEWYGVKTGVWNRQDALQVFNAYFEGNSSYRTTAQPAQVLEPEHYGRRRAVPTAGTAHVSGR
jgi:hypothetical protein